MAQQPAWRTVPVSSQPAPTRRGWVRLLVIVLVSGLVAAGAVFGVVTILNLGTSAPPLDRRCEATANGLTARLELDQTANAALIAQVALRRELPPHAVTVALATAMQESRIRNLDYGDRDSLGIFQQRPSQGWGSEAEVQDPVYASNKFYEELAKVSGWETLPVTEAAQAVQRSAFPDAYAAHEDIARRFASALTGQSPAGLTCYLDHPKAAGNSKSLVKDLRRSVGKTIEAKIIRPGATSDNQTLAPDEAGLVQFSGSDEAMTWALAAWAVAVADVQGVVAVDVVGWHWDREAAAWTAITPDVESSAELISANQVLVSLAP